MTGDPAAPPTAPAVGVVPVPRCPAPPEICAPCGSRSEGGAPAAGAWRARTRDDGHLDPSAVLSRRDLELLSCLASGRSTAQIATVLAVSSNTARTRIRRVEHKLSVEGRVAAVRAARDLGVLTPGTQTGARAEPGQPPGPVPH